MNNFWQYTTIGVQSYPLVASKKSLTLDLCIYDFLIQGLVTYTCKYAFNSSPPFHIFRSLLSLFSLRISYLSLSLSIVSLTCTKPNVCGLVQHNSTQLSIRPVLQ